jgi:hypothetical protein
MKSCLRGTGAGRRGSREAAAKPTVRRPRSAFSLAQKCFGDLLCKPEFAARQVADPQTAINGESLGWPVCQVAHAQGRHATDRLRGQPGRPARLGRRRPLLAVLRRVEGRREASRVDPPGVLRRSLRMGAASSGQGHVIVAD